MFPYRHYSWRQRLRIEETVSRLDCQRCKANEFNISLASEGASLKLELLRCGISKLGLSII